jgi:uncharacterized membrane protein YdbT with pleckstrin-like domain
VSQAGTDSGYLPPGGANHTTESKVVWLATEGQVRHWLTYVLCMLFAWTIVPVLYAIYRYLATAAHTYQLTDQRLIEHSGLISKSTQVLELYRVKDLSIQQDFLPRLLGRGNIVLETSDRSTPTVTMLAVPGVHRVADLIREHVERARVAKGVREID